MCSDDDKIFGVKKQDVIDTLLATGVFTIAGIALILLL